MGKLEVPGWLFPLFSWVFAAYLVILFHLSTDILHQPAISEGSYLLLILAIILVFLPFMKRLKFGTLFELERDIRETKKEMKDFKNEIRQSLSVISTSINTIGNVTSNISITIPGMAELLDAKEKLTQSSDAETLESSKEVKEELFLEGEDTIMALARTRIKLEYLLRKILGKRTLTPEVTKEIRFMTLGKLYRHFLKEYPKFRNLENSFTYVGQIANAAVHAQRLPEGQAQEALELGAKLIAILKKLAENSESTYT